MSSKKKTNAPTKEELDAAHQKLSELSAQERDALFSSASTNNLFTVQLTCAGLGIPTKLKDALCYLLLHGEIQASKKTNKNPAFCTSAPSTWSSLLRKMWPAGKHTIDNQNERMFL